MEKARIMQQSSKKERNWTQKWNFGTTCSLIIQFFFFSIQFSSLWNQKLILFILMCCNIKQNCKLKILKNKSARKGTWNAPKNYDVAEIFAIVISILKHNDDDCGTSKNIFVFCSPAVPQTSISWTFQLHEFNKKLTLHPVQMFGVSSLSIRLYGHWTFQHNW